MYKVIRFRWRWKTSWEAEGVLASQEGFCFICFVTRCGYPQVHTDFLVMNLTNVFESIHRLCLLKVVQWDWLPLCNGLNAVLFSFPLPTWRRGRSLQDDVLLINADGEQCLNVTKLRCSETQSIPQSTGVALFRILPHQLRRELKFMFSFRVEVQVYEIRYTAENVIL